MNERKYFITGINRLTGEREIISGYFTRERAENVFAQLKLEHDSLRTLCHSHLKIELIKKLNHYGTNQGRK